MTFSVSPKGILYLDGDELMLLGTAKNRTGLRNKQIAKDPAFPERIESGGRLYCRVKDVEAYQARQRAAHQALRDQP